jgi:hypothetical protein
MIRRGLSASDWFELMTRQMAQAYFLKTHRFQIV